MTGIDLDKEIRLILISVTPATSLSATAALIRLGFSPRSSWTLIRETLAAKAAGRI